MVSIFKINDRDFVDISFLFPDDKRSIYFIPAYPHMLELFELEQMDSQDALRKMLSRFGVNNELVEKHLQMIFLEKSDLNTIKDKLSKTGELGTYYLACSGDDSELGKGVCIIGDSASDTYFISDEKGIAESITQKIWALPAYRINQDKFVELAQQEEIVI